MSLSEHEQNQRVLAENVKMIAGKCEGLVHWTSAWVLPKADNVIGFHGHGLWTFYGTQVQEEANEVEAPKGTSQGLVDQLTAATGAPVFQVTRQVKHSYVLTAVLPVYQCSMTKLAEFHAVVNAVATELGAPRDGIERRVFSQYTAVSPDGTKPGTPEAVTVSWRVLGAHRQYDAAIGE